jgi:cobalt-precorrin 5A hydrolase/precorrin-3B C17-methyltransferase
VGSDARAASASELLIYPRSVAVAVGADVADLPDAIRDSLQQAGVAIQSLTCLVAADTQMASPVLREAALELAVPLRFVAPANDIGELARDAVSAARIITTSRDIAIAVAEQPLDVSQVGRPRGRLAVIGLGPGAAELMVPAVKADWLGPLTCWVTKPTCAWPVRSATIRCSIAPTTAKKCSVPVTPSGWRLRAVR